MPTSAKPITQAILARKPRDSEIDCYGLTHQGKVRKTNNDHFLIASLHKRTDVVLSSLPGLADDSNQDERVAFLAMVADGVGGSETGEEASRITLETVTDFLSTSLQAYYASDAKGDALQQALQEAANHSHESVVQRAKERADSRVRATTLTLFVGVWPWAYILQVGDSRYYVYRDGVLTQCTRDQTFAQDLVDAGALTPGQAAGSRLKHVLSSSIGGDQTMPVVSKFPSNWSNVHLFCSDGLTKHVTDDQIKLRLETMTSSKQACEALLQDALDGGGTDNITVLVGRTVPED